MKTCTKCGEEKALSEYHKNKDGRFGLTAACNKCKAAKAKKHREENKEKLAAQKKKYRAENKEKIAEKVKKYHEANREKIAAYGKKWREENKEKIAAQRKKYHKDHPERKAAWNAKRKAIKASLPGHFTAAEFNAICEKYNNRCLCCGKKRKLTADHVVPITWPSSTNYISNIQPLCGPCNSSKRNHHATDYRI